MSQRKQSKRNISTKRHDGLSQTTLDGSFFTSQLQNSEEKLKELAHNCVRYVIFRAHSNGVIRRNEMQEAILQGDEGGKYFDKVVKEATEILKNVYGYNLVFCENAVGTKLKYYIVSNDLDHTDASYSDDDENGESYPEDSYKILVMLVLTHIFMSAGAANETSLFAFLENLDINVDGKHSLFGDVKAFINVKMVKDKYLITEADRGTKRLVYRWGPRADSDISKLKLLKFVGNMFDDRNPRSWRDQYQEAEEQSREREVINQMEQ